MLGSNFYIGYKPEKILKTKYKQNISRSIHNTWPFGHEEGGGG